MKYNNLNSCFYEVFARPERIKVLYGGAGSGKSISIAQWFIQQLWNGDGIRLAIFRKHFPSMKASTYLVIKDILIDWGVPYTENKTDHVIKVGKNELYYLSLDDPEKIKGAEYAAVWLEEATEFTQADYNQLRIRLSRTSEDAEIFLSFNPIDAHHWVVRDVVEQATSDNRICVNHSTYKDNVQNLSQAFVDELESFCEIDENFYRVYALGLPGVLKGQIYTNWKFEDPAVWPTGYYQGMNWLSIDFGFNAPMPVAETFYYDGEYYIRERLYERGMTTNDLITWFRKEGISKTIDIYCDSAEPDRIEELCRAGYNAKPSKKDVKAGIDFVKAQSIHVDATCSPNIQKEYNNYKWKEDKAGNSLDEPVKAFDHILDAIRYGIYTAPTEPVRAVSKVKMQKSRFSGFSAARPTF